MRQLKVEMGRGNTLNVHVTLVPYIPAARELKTKPTQHSVRSMREIGMEPEIIICRCDRPIPPDEKEKIGLFCNVPKEAVITGEDVPSIYQVPISLQREGLDKLLMDYMGVWAPQPKMERWQHIVDTMNDAKSSVTIGVVGKYVDLVDAYKSLHEALLHGGIANHARVNLRYIDSEEVERRGAAPLLDGVDGVLVPGGFGVRGIEGKIAAVRYAREGNVPFFGICLGLQVATIEFARDVCGLKDANSLEFEPQAEHLVIHLMESQRNVTQKGGSMRLGAYPCRLEPGTLAARTYGSEEISERHRHRYEVNNRYREAMEARGLVFSGRSPDGQLVEMIELPEHPWFLGCQFHPEFKSRPYAPHPLFSGFVAAALRYQADRS
jgi:CTP synthase